MQRISFVALAVLLLAPVAVAAQTLERIATDGTLRLGHRTTAVPFSYVDRTTGEPSGYSVELCAALVDDLVDAAGIETVEIVHVPVTAETRFNAVAEGEIDLLCGAATQTLSRRAVVDFSIPTFVDGAGIAVKEGGARSFADLEGGSIAVVAGTTTEQALASTIEQDGLDITLEAVSDHDAGLAALREDRVGAYVADRAILLFLVRNADAEDVIVAGDQLTVETHALALTRGDTEFRLAVDQALSRVYLNGTAEVLFKDAFGASAEMTPLLRALYRLSALPR